VEHGRPPGIRYSFTLHVESDRLLGHLRDGGPPLDEYERPMPDTDSENGRGLALARVALDDLEYQRADAVCGATGILLR
jgi:anti-sigma regulatory factor (Ser/Thr protein kinase)